MKLLKHLAGVVFDACCPSGYSRLPACSLNLFVLNLYFPCNAIQAEEHEEQNAELNGIRTPAYKSGHLVEALMRQKRDTLNIVPESYVEQTNLADESQRGKRLRRDLPTFDNFQIGLDKKFSSFDAPLNRTGPVNYFASRVNQEYITFPENDGKNVVYGSQDVQIGNFFPDNPNGTNVYGPILVQKNNTYRGKNENAQYGASITQIGNRYPERHGKNDIYTGVVVQNGNTYPVNPGNKTSFAININQSNNTYPKSIENNKDALKPIIDHSGNFYPSSNDSEAGMNTKNNTETRGGSVEQNTSDGQGNTSSTNYDSDSSSYIESTTQHYEERKAHANKHIAPNGQKCLSSSVLISLSYSFLILVKCIPS
ncbi:unnamed protein product [Danaus chrysippus]|uniref:(African queen) hypothetical protein n=1 Tax=Danaus chrysippus TaxID=151541 RepID=A0A8J2VWW3_9NEOP|nr:unnamed protein product [Danaus chrysippus]